MTRRLDSPWRKSGAAAACGIVLFALALKPTEAHKPITSKYTYNDDVFPIFRDRCGACHLPGGAAPMSLLSYKESVPWAESIREELTAERMPPWYVDDESAPVRGGHSLSARELDTLVTWATGGAPEGDVTKRPPPPALRSEWPAGAPDLVVPMDAEYTMPAETQEETRELTLPTAFAGTRWVKAADLLPGTPSMVRDATIAIDRGAVLAAWVPGHAPIAAPDATAFRLPAGARLRLRIHYKKSWQDERSPKSDRSAIGLYFTNAPPPGHELRDVVVDRAHEVAGAVRVVAIRPSLDQPYASVDVHATLPTGAVVPLLRLRAPRPEWPRRYWLARPADLPTGSRIDVTATPAAPDSDTFAADAAPTRASRPSSLRLHVDVVSR